MLVTRKVNFILLFFLSFSIFISCSKELLDLELYQIRAGSLRDNEYDYYKLTLPNEFDKDSNLIIELEPNKQLDSVNNIISDPNLYISKIEKMPSITENTWSSNSFGDEIILISSANLNPSENFYISVHCKEKCNYILSSQLIKDIAIRDLEINHYSLNSKAATRYSFTTCSDFKELYVNVISSFINPFKVYLAKDDPSSSNTLPASPIIFNGYRFTIKKFDDSNNLNTNKKFILLVDNEGERQDLTIWLQYDNQNILIREAEILYDSINENKANCYYYPIDYLNKNKDIIISTNIFNGQGFIHMAGFNSIKADSVKLSDKNKASNYIIIQSKAIRLTKEEYKNYGSFKENEKTFLNFCFYAEKSTSLSIKVYFLENYKRLQALNVLYPGIEVEDIIPKNSLKKYRIEHFNIEKDISISLVEKTGKPTLYLFMAKPEEESKILDFKDLDNLKKNNQIAEANYRHNSYYLFLPKELNKSIKNEITNRYSYYLNAIVECKGNEDCTYNLKFDHTKNLITMLPKKIYSNAISENESDHYKIIISDTSVKNLVITLIQNTGKSLLRLENFTSEDATIELGEEKQNNEFLPHLIKISSDKLNIANLKGSFTLKVKGLSYASYSLYYYTFNDEENTDALEQDNVIMNLEKGKIIKDIFLDAHKFKVYMYDSSTIGNKTNLFIGLVESDNTNLELYVFKDLNDFSIFEDRISGYLWTGDYRDYLYIDKNDDKYLENDILYIMIFKKNNYYSTGKKDTYTSFYLGITDENTPLLLNEGIEFKYYLTRAQSSQKFYYYYLKDEEKEKDLQISFSLFYGHITAKIEINNNIYSSKYINEEASLIVVKGDEISKFCSKKNNCGITIEIQNDDSYRYNSNFLISVRSGKNTPIYLKQGIINRRTILSGEEQHFIIDLKPNELYGAKISAMFSNGQGELYARRLLRSEMFENNNFPDENNYEYKSTYIESKNDFYLIEIPYSDFGGHSYCQLLLTVKGIFPGYSYTRIEYSISISNTLNEIVTDKNYKLFISQGEITNFHFKVGNNIKRLYISMSNKEKEANMFLSNNQYITNLYEYTWIKSGTYNNYLDLSINDPYFLEKGISDLDGDYYLAIQGVEDTFYNLYISSQDVKIITLSDNSPGVCECETENDNCYFRYENIYTPIIEELYEKKVIFYTEFTYGRGSMYAKLYNNGNMDEILNNLPSKTNNDAFTEDSREFLLMNIEQENPKYNTNSVAVVNVQCKQKSLFDLSAILLDSNTDASRSNSIFLTLDKDNVYYLSSATGMTKIFMYYLYKNEDINFRVKSLLGQAKIHTYSNDSISNGNKNTGAKNYHHIHDFEIDSSVKGKNEYFGRAPKEYAYRNYLYIEVKPITDCLINMNVNYDKKMKKIVLNKEITAVLNDYNYYAYYDFSTDIDEVIITVTSLDKNRLYDVFIKKNIINRAQIIENEDIDNYSKASSHNYDLKGKTNPLTSAISLRIKNVPNLMRNETQIIRLLINIESFYYSYDKKIKILITPVINNVSRINPEQNMYIFTGLENKNVEKVIFTLKNTNKDNDLMIIELSSCKGNYVYFITDTPPLDTETYQQLNKRKLPSNIYSSNGKKIIIMENLDKSEYYLTIFGIRGSGLKEIIFDAFENANVEVLFYYYSTKKSNYNYLVSQDSLKYESKDNFHSLKLFIPKPKRRDTYGKENDVDSMNYTFVVTNKYKDLKNMESTCYLTKLQQKEKGNYNYLTVKFNQKTNSFDIKGLKEDENYYMNVLAENGKTGGIITYKPVHIKCTAKPKNTNIFIVILLVVIIIFFLYGVFYIYRKYRIKKLQLAFVEENNSKNSLPSKKGNLNNINLDFIKTNDTSIN